MLTDNLQALLRWPTRLIAALTGIITIVIWGAIAGGNAELWNYGLVLSITLVAHSVAAILIETRQVTFAVALSTGTHLAAGGAITLFFPDLRLSVAVTIGLAMLIVGAIGSARQAYILIITAAATVGLLSLQPLIPIPSYSLGNLAVPIEFISLVPCVVATGLLSRYLVQQERRARLALAGQIRTTEEARQALATALEQLKATQEQLLQAAQDRAVTDLAAAAAHELAQPLTILLNEAALLFESGELSEVEAASLANLYTAARRSSQILNRIRDVRRYVATSYIPGTTMLDLDNAGQPSPPDQVTR